MFSVGICIYILCIYIVLCIEQCLYSLTSVFIHLTFFSSLSTSRSNRHWNTRLDFPHWLFLTYLPNSLLKPPFLLCCACVRVRVEVSGGKLPVIAFVRSWEWANAAIAVVTVCFVMIELPRLEGFWKGWVFMVDMVVVICHKIIPTELFTGLNI